MHTEPNTELIAHHLGEMRQTIKEIDNKAESLFFKAHLEGMEELAELQRLWQVSDPENRAELKEKIVLLREKLTESLDVLKSGMLQ